MPRYERRNYPRNARIAVTGVMSTPGVAVDGKLAHAGGLPDKAKLEEWLAA